MPSPGKLCPSIPSGGGIGQPGEQKLYVGGIDSILHTALASSPQPWEETCPPGDTQTQQRDLCGSWR